MSSEVSADYALSVLGVCGGCDHSEPSRCLLRSAGAFLFREDVGLLIILAARGVCMFTEDEGPASRPFLIYGGGWELAFALLSDFGRQR